MTARVTQIDHVEVFVPDREEAARWYRETLGLERVSRAAHWAEHPDGPLMISSDGGSTMVALFTGPAQGDDEVRGLRRLAFRCDADTLRSFATQLDCAPVDHGTAKSIYFSDPWGNDLEITTYDLGEPGETT